MCVCVCRFCNVCVCVGFLMCVCVCVMYGFCNVLVCVCVDFVMCGYFGNMFTCIYSVFVLFLLCIFLLICY